MRQPIEHVRPLAITTTIDEVEVTIKPITVGEYPALFVHLSPLLEIVPLVPDGLFDRMENGQASAADLLWLAGILMAQGSHAIGLLALATRQPQEWVSNLLPDRALELLLLVLQVNSDFFSRARGPMAAMLESARASLPATAASAGPSPSTP